MRVGNLLPGEEELAVKDASAGDAQGGKALNQLNIQAKELSPRRRKFKCFQHWRDTLTLLCGFPILISTLSGDLLYSLPPFLSC